MPNFQCFHVEANSSIQLLLLCAKALPFTLWCTAYLQLRCQSVELPATKVTRHSNVEAINTSADRRWSKSNEGFLVGAKRASGETVHRGHSQRGQCDLPSKNVDSNREIKVCGFVNENCHEMSSRCMRVTFRRVLSLIWPNFLVLTKNLLWFSVSNGFYRGNRIEVLTYVKSCLCTSKYLSTI